MDSRITRYPKTLLLGLLLAQLGSANAQEQVARSGPELYRQYCASCHGVSGRGDGPVAASLRVEVPNLTRLAKRQGGFFDRARVARIIDGRYVIGAHGTRTMPIWGEDLARVSVGDPNAQRAINTIIDRLADYVWQLQTATEPQRAP